MDATTIEEYVRIAGSDPEDTFRSALDGLGKATTGPDPQGQWSSQCPAHDDNSPSLHWFQTSNHVVKFNCFAGCGGDEILKALRLRWYQLKPVRYEFDYFDRVGTYLFTVKRTQQADGGKKITQMRRAPDGTEEDGNGLDKGQSVMWLEPELESFSEDCRAHGQRMDLWIPEGEKDTIAITGSGSLGEWDFCTTVPGGAKNWLTCHTARIADLWERGLLGSVVLVCDDDKAGFERGFRIKDALAEALPDLVVRVLAPTGEDVGDLCDQYGRRWTDHVRELTGSEITEALEEGSAVTGFMIRYPLGPGARAGRMGMAIRIEGEEKDSVRAVLAAEVEPLSIWDGGWVVRVTPPRREATEAVLTHADLSSKAAFDKWMVKARVAMVPRCGIGTGEVAQALGLWLDWAADVRGVETVVVSEYLTWVDPTTGEPARVASSGEGREPIWIAPENQRGSGVRWIGVDRAGTHWGREGTEAEAAWAWARALTFGDEDTVAAVAGWAGAMLLAPWIGKWMPTKPGLAVIAPSGSGKAQPLSEPVLTPTGWKPMGELGVGSEVVGRDGQPTRVLGVYPQGEQDVHRVWFDDGSSARCTADHLWYTETSLDRRAWGDGRKGGGRPGSAKTTAEIAATIADSRGARNHAVPLVEASDGHESGAELPIGPYALGALLGDGCFVGDAARFSTVDPENLDRLLADIGDPRVRAVAKRNQSGNDDYILRGDGRTNPVRRAIASLGLWGHRSWEKWIPDVYKYGSVKTRWEVLRGLMDTDGWAGPSVEFGTSSERLARDVRDLVWSLGGTARLRQKPTRTGRACWTVAMRVSECPFHLGRKVEAWWARSAKARPVTHRLVDRIELEGREEAQCIRVDAADSLYVTRDWTVTHNTYGAPRLLLQLAGCDGNATSSVAGLRRRLSQGGVSSIQWIDDSSILDDYHLKEILRVATSQGEHILANPDGGAGATSSVRLVGCIAVSAEGVSWMEEVAMQDRFLNVRPHNPQGRKSLRADRVGEAQWADVQELMSEYDGELTRVARWTVDGMARQKGGVARWVEDVGAPRGRSDVAAFAAAVGARAVATWLYGAAREAGSQWPGKTATWADERYSKWKWLVEAADRRLAEARSAGGRFNTLVNAVLPAVMRAELAGVTGRGMTTLVAHDVDATSADSMRRSIYRAVQHGEALETALPMVLVDRDGRVWVWTSAVAGWYESRFRAKAESRINGAKALADQCDVVEDNPEWAHWVDTKGGGRSYQRPGIRIGKREMGRNRATYRRMSAEASEAVLDGA